jgi:hypothetical protein
VNSGSCCIAEDGHLLVIEAWSGPILPDLGAVPQDAFGVELHSADARRVCDFAAEIRPVR